MHAFPRRELEATGEMPDTVTRVVGRPTPHESARLHVTGQARYTDDLPLPPGSLHGWPVTSSHAHSLIRVVDVSEASTTPGVVAVLMLDPNGLAFAAGNGRVRRGTTVLT